MNEEKTANSTVYNSFENLFADASHYVDALRKELTAKTKYALLELYRFEFNNWLAEKCNWNGKPGTYKQFLTKAFFLQFMQFKFEQEREQFSVFEKERKDWEVSSLTLTHRHYAIADKFKFDSCELTSLPTREQQRKAGGKKREQAYDSINPVSNTYKPITPKELKKVIEALEAFPKAKQAALKELSALEKS